MKSRYILCIIFLFVGISLIIYSICIGDGVESFKFVFGTFYLIITALEIYRISEEKLEDRIEKLENKYKEKLR